MIDIVFPNNNEEEFCEIARKLGWHKLALIYPSIDKIPKKLPDNCISGVLTDVKRAYEVKKKVTLTLIKSTGDDREALERAKPTIMYGFETNTRKDFIHHRASGLNHVLANIAARNNVMIGFSFKTLLDAQEKWRGTILGRMAQNETLIRKAKAQTIFASFATEPYEMRAPKELESVFSLIGVNQLKELTFLK